MELEEKIWTKDLNFYFGNDGSEPSAGQDIHLLRRAFFQRHLDKGLKAKNLAKHCGISASLLTMLLKGDRKLGAGAQYKVESSLGLASGSFSNATFLREALLCDFSGLDAIQPQFKEKAGFSTKLNSQHTKTSEIIGALAMKQEIGAGGSETLSSASRDFDLSSLNQMVKLSQCQVSVETIGVKGNELTLMVKLKF